MDSPAGVRYSLMMAKVGTLNDVSHAEFMAKHLDQGCLSRPHRAIKCKYPG